MWNFIQNSREIVNLLPVGAFRLLMKVIRIEIRHKNALQILKDLEVVNLIKIMPPETNKKSISKALRGSLTKKKAEELGKQLKTMRGEWNRSI